MLFVNYRKILAEGLLSVVAYSLIAGGAVGNMIDRLRIGSVVDFLDFRVWPVFNIADVVICIGVGLLICSLFYSRNMD